MIIFNIFKIRKLIKEAKENPGKVASEELSGALVGMVFVPIVIFSVILILLFIFGFTNLFFGASLIAKILFYIILVLYIILILLVRSILRKIKKHTESVTNNTVDRMKS